MKFAQRVKFGVCSIVLLLFACTQEPTHHGTTGYIEIQHFYISAPESGWITELNLTEGQVIELGDRVATLDRDYQLLNQQELEVQSANALSQLENLQQGARAEEIEVLKSQLNEMQQNSQLAEVEYARLVKLLNKELVSQAEVDKAKFHQQGLKFAVQSVQAQIAAARLPARDKVIESAQQQFRASQIASEKANWQLQRRSIIAHNRGTVEQIFYRQGEFVNQGQPLMSVAIVNSKKVRFYVAQERLNQVKIGNIVKVISDGRPEGDTAKISYISNHTEFTPPVLYGKGARDSLVFLVEASFERPVNLNQGQPVDVLFSD
ncbi:HlyD family efflux transporter periplasmic adaptor subunit [Aliiglaciecola sp. LCG003]|uniref:HlyD family secretion protein n=1 Tax=Aliiglaciecola sp. LCG003 TaxID=3053655 RepID=UPI0025731391|nr:HlyD family efflux transporter periplasmic adaptor subunit [Aliiglaciecola sp. LCG003]WJG10714.1 HlyD family efflux transporter periplasmic adaptor subunit [Aliiglaciecola sp. LCG003]